MILLVSVAMMGFAYSPADQLEFADYLVEQGDYRRAIGEYERYLFMVSGDGDDHAFDYANYRLGWCHEMLGQYRKAIERYERVSWLEARYRIACSQIKLGNYSSALRTLASLPDSGTFRERVALLQSASLILAEDPAAYSLLNAVETDGRYSQVKRELIEVANERRSYRRKNPLLAAGLSTVVPGLGKIYAQRAFDGLYSLVVLLASSFLAYDGFHDDGSKSVKGWTFVGISVFIHAGNIYGSYVAAKCTNLEHDLALKEAIFDAIDPLLADHLGHGRFAGTR